MDYSPSTIVYSFIREIQVLLKTEITIPFEIILLCNKYYIMSSTKFIATSISDRETDFISLNVEDKQLITNNIITITINNDIGCKVNETIIIDKPYCYISNIKSTSNKTLMQY